MDRKLTPNEIFSSGGYVYMHLIALLLILRQTRQHVFHIIKTGYTITDDGFLKSVTKTNSKYTPFEPSVLPHKSAEIVLELINGL